MRYSVADCSIELVNSVRFSWSERAENRVLFIEYSETETPNWFRGPTGHCARGSHGLAQLNRANGAKDHLGLAILFEKTDGFRTRENSEQHGH
ncbi:hypothetical protein V6N13_105955 [Hibiscus sabdariffa]